MQPNGVIITDRPSYPRKFIHTVTKDNLKVHVPGLQSNYSIPMTWHHMIPWNTLKAGWNALVSNQRWETLEVWLGLLDRETIQEPEQVLKDIMSGILGMPTRENAETSLCWSTWNLVEGPSHRTDDPEDDFDNFVSSRISGQKLYRFHLLKQIYQSMMRITYRRDLDKKDTNQLLRQLTELKPYKSTPIVMFDTSMWDIQIEGNLKSDGLVSEKFPMRNTGTNGTISGHPVWAKITT